MRATAKCVAIWILRLEALALAAAALPGCTGAPVRIDYETDGHLSTSTGERLYRVRASEVGALYLKPGVRFADYRSVALRPVSLEYREPPRVPGSMDHGPGNFRLRPDASERLKRDLGEALAGELARHGSYRVVAQEAEDTLLIAPHITQLRWETPPEQGGESLYVRRTGSATLVLDLRDARTGALLARLADARLIRPGDVGPARVYESSPANNRAGVRNLTTHWASLLRGTLETLRELPPMPSPGGRLD